MSTIKYKHNSLVQCRQNRFYSPDVRNREICVISKWKTKWLAVNVPDAWHHSKISIQSKQHSKTKLKTEMTWKFSFVSNTRYHTSKTLISTHRPTNLNALMVHVWWRFFFFLFVVVGWGGWDLRTQKRSDVHLTLVITIPQLQIPILSSRVRIN